MNTRTPENVLAQEKPLTVAEEMAKFSGFTTNNGETVDPKSAAQRRGVSDTNLSEEERAAGAKVINEQPRAGAKTPAAGEEKPAKVELTEEEGTAAIDAARAALKLKDDEELTEEEEAEALAAALKDKKASAKDGSPRDVRVKRAQEGRRRAEARAARAEGKLATLEQRIAAVEQNGGKPLDTAAKGGKDDADKEPDASKFELGELDPKYIRALARWEVRQELAENSKTQQTQRQTASQQEAAAERTAKMEAFEDAGHDKFEDFQEVVLDTVKLPKSDPAAWPLSATIGSLMLDSKFGTDIAYALASDPKEAKRVDKLSDAEKQRWFFRQEAKLESEDSGEADGEEQEESEQTERPARRTPAPARIASRAPIPPARRSNGGNGNRGGISPATQDFAAFEAMANGKKDR